MNKHVWGLASKGILNNTLTSKGVLISSITEEIIIPPIKRPRDLTSGYGGPYQELPTKKKIRIKFWYEGKEYYDEKIVDINFRANAKNIDIEIIDNKPTIKFIVEEK